MDLCIVFDFTTFILYVSKFCDNSRGLFSIKKQTQPILRKQRLPKHTKIQKEYQNCVFNSYDSQRGISNSLVQKFEKNFYSNSKFDPNDYKEKSLSK